MDARVYVVISIILVTGLLGGFAAFLLESGADQKLESTRRVLVRSLLLGVLSALCVPLFLSLAKSGLIGNIFAPAGNPPKPPAFEDYLILAGLCAIAAISSRRFLDSVTRQVLQRVGNVEQKAEAARATAVDASRKADRAATEVQLGEAADEPNAPPPPEEAVVGFTGALPSELQLNEEERKALQALTTRTYRTRTGIADDSGIPKSKISELLESLAERKLALPTTSPRTGGARWIITKRGLAAIKPD